MSQLSPPAPVATGPGRRILLLATLDTKQDEAAFVAEAIRSRGHEPVVVDLSLRGGAPRSADVTPEALAAVADLTPDELAGRPRAEAMEIVAAAATAVVAPLVARGEVHAAIGLGGGTGTWLSSTVFEALPHGFPKLVVSTLTGRDGSHDVMVMPSVVDIAGLNRLLVPVLANAAAAVCGMAEGVAVPFVPERPTIAVTMFGVTTEGATHLREFLEEAGCEVVTFHANGTGGRTMEQLVRQGAFTAVVDWTTSEITDELVGGICTAGPERLDAAAATGVPQIVVPGAVDVINVAGEIPERFAGRAHHWHLPSVPLIRTSVEESAAIGTWMARKLVSAQGPARVLVPGEGFSALDAPGGVFEDKQADEAWRTALEASLGDHIPVEVVPAHINSAAFARVAADRVIALAGLTRRADEAVHA